MSRDRAAAAAATVVGMVVVVVVALWDGAGRLDTLTALLVVLALGLLVESRLAQRRAGGRLDAVQRRNAKIAADAHWARKNAFAVFERVRGIDQRTRRMEPVLRGVRRTAPYRYAQRITEWRQVESLQNLYALLPPRQAVPAMRGWAASPDLLLLVVGHVLEHRPQTVVECGSGSSTLWIAYALERLGGGRVISLEHDPHFAERTRELLARHGLAGYADVRDARLTQVGVGGEDWVWYDPAAVADLPPIDLLLVDGPPVTTGPLARYPAGPLLFDRLSPAGVVVLDDAVREEERTIAARWTEEMQLLCEHVTDLEKEAFVLRSPSR